MEGTAAVAAKTEEKVPGKLVSAGVPVRADMSVGSFTNPPDDSDKVEADKDKNAADEKVKLDAGGNAVVDNKDKVDPAKTDPPKFTEADFLAFAKEQGIEVADIKTLKEKVAGPAAAKTDDQLKAEATELEKKIISAHLKRGGTVEQYTTLKQIVSADPKVLGLTKIEEELVKDGFTKDQSALILKRMHLQYTDDEIADFTPEQKNLVQKEAAYGIKKQENRGKFIQNTAKSYLDSLKEEVQEQDAENQKSAKHTSKVEDAIKNFVRKQTIKLGEYNGETLDPVDIEISDDVLATVKDILSDQAKIKTTLYNADGELNLDFLIPHLVASVSRETSVKHAFLSGQTKQVDFFKAKFGDKIPDLGGSARAKGTPGKIVGAGKPEYMRPSEQK